MRHDAEKLLAPACDLRCQRSRSSRAFLRIPGDRPRLLLLLEGISDLGPVTLLSFDVDFFRPPKLASEQTRGPDRQHRKVRAQRLLGNATDVGEHLQIESNGTDGTSSRSASRPPTVRWPDADVFQDYKVRKGSRIIIDGGEGDDSFDLNHFTESGVLFDIDLGAGNDTVVWPGTPRTAWPASSPRSTAAAVTIRSTGPAGATSSSGTPATMSSTPTVVTTRFVDEGGSRPTRAGS